MLEVMCAFFPPKKLWVYVRGKKMLFSVIFLLPSSKGKRRGFENPIKTIYFPFEFVPVKVSLENGIFSSFKKRFLKQLKLLPHKPERNKKDITGEFPTNTLLTVASTVAVRALKKRQKHITCFFIAGFDFAFLLK